MQKKSKELLEQVQKILSEYSEQLTLRQIYYQNGILTELWIAREILEKERGRGPLPEFRDKCPKTWEQYCQDIGIEKRTANRWLARAFDDNQRETEHKEIILQNVEIRKGDFKALHEIPEW